MFYLMVIYFAGTVPIYQINAGEMKETTCLIVKQQQDYAKRKLDNPSHRLPAFSCVRKS
jgi:hypothetical protein